MQRTFNNHSMSAILLYLNTFIDQWWINFFVFVLNELESKIFIGFQFLHKSRLLILDWVLLLQHSRLLGFGLLILNDTNTVLLHTIFFVSLYQNILKLLKNTTTISFKNLPKGLIITGLYLLWRVGFVIAIPKDTAETEAWRDPGDGVFLDGSNVSVQPEASRGRGTWATKDKLILILMLIKI